MSKLLLKTIKQLGTQITLKVPSSFFSDCQNELKRIEEKYSRFLDDSQLSQANKQLGEWQKVDAEFMFLLYAARQYFTQTDGAFDISLKQRLDELGYDKDYLFSKQKVSNPFVWPWQSAFELDGQKVLLRKPIEIGGFGKGFAADRLGALLRDKTQTEFLINMGGDILVGSQKEDILLEHPDDSSKAIAKVTLQNNAIASSSSNRRRWKDGHHLLNASTGKPENSLKAVWVVADTCMDADAYATSLFSVGFEKAQELTCMLDADVLLISAEDKMFVSGDFELFD